MTKIFMGAVCGVLLSAGCALAGQNTFDPPPGVNIPEPGSLALLALGAGALAFYRGRRRS